MIEVNVRTAQDAEHIARQIYTSASEMYAHGFDIVPSWYKVPNVCKWKGTDRKDMLDTLNQGLKAWLVGMSGKSAQNPAANSFNVRMKDGLCALDCDFPEAANEHITDDFIQALRHVGFHHEYIQTVQGKKGCKIFFVCTEVPAGESLPRVLFPAALSPDDRKFELELKVDVATVCGMYDEGHIYDTYPGRKSFVDSARGNSIDAPCFLHRLPFYELEHVMWLCRDVLCQYDIIKPPETQMNTIRAVLSGSSLPVDLLLDFGMCFCAEHATAGQNRAYEQFFGKTKQWLVKALRSQGMPCNVSAPLVSLWEKYRRCA